MNYLMWLLKAAIFFTLFAFALNNQQVIAVNFFFGTFWKAPLVLVVLTAFGTGLALGVLLMMPRWWKKRRLQNSFLKQQLATVSGESSGKMPSGPPEITGIPRHGL